MSEAPLTAFVTGSGRNIGRAVAIDLATRGMRVVVHGNRNREGAEETAANVRAAGCEALVVMGDLGVREDVGAMATQALAAFGSVDVLVNNAAIRPQSPLEELGPSGITVNAVSPGPIATEHPDNPEMARHIASLLGRIPLGRLGTSEEVAALCGHLCSREGGYISGQMIACNGAGQT